MKSILIVDDNQDMRFLLENILVIHGYNVDTVDDGERAVKYLEDVVPDLVLLDIRLPKLNGIEVLKKIKEKDENIKVILLTAYSNIASRNKSIEFGANDYITKPFDNDELLVRINGIIWTWFIV